MQRVQTSVSVQVLPSTALGSTLIGYEERYFSKNISRLKPGAWWSAFSLNKN